jgi:hypothetical protein
MSPQELASEHLRVIRTLMERAQVYRAISAPAALTGGSLALMAAMRLYFLKVEPSTFLLVWLALLVVASKVNALLLYVAALEKKRPFWSAETKLAVRTLAPPMLAAGLLGILVALVRRDLALTSIIWVFGYGCALLATGNFSPRSIKHLGRAFFVSGIVAAFVWAKPENWSARVTDLQFSCVVMGLTFGLLHVAYAVAVFIRRPKPVE